MEQPQSFSSHERLKSQKIITSVLSEGVSLSKYPLKVFYLNTVTARHQVAVAVPKRAIKLAVNRNQLKRRMREAYRLHKSIIEGRTPAYMFFIYTAKDSCTYQIIEAAMIHLLHVLNRRLSTSNNA